MIFMVDGAAMTGDGAKKQRFSSGKDMVAAIILEMLQ